ncbi:HAD-IB family hydrolase [Pseudonocardia xinjiangensis]|uniref:1-acyl-sn-glycerol-3-phosphate acyltransferase n=1 Tax=Pseudonocardia xinjiangensis TaxID=75289 RepID=A0ABX1RII6_9PSEU|nr:HAD-IB family hydrolase [Pseudonocardia xinjiangensis]NMH80205.1 HAD-IB family hydrolase [Pseudonocardia xinjiangensis]
MSTATSGSAGQAWSEEQLLADVEAGPQGPRVGAFFDFDGTLIDGYSLGAFARHHMRSGHVTPGDIGRMLLLGMRGLTTEEDFEDFFVLGMRAWAGRHEDELAELGERLWTQAVAGSLYPEAWRLVEAHRRAGHTVVLASSATRFQVEPAARAMGVDHVLVTPVEIENGLCTGRPGGPPLWRAGKAAAVRTFAQQHGIDLAESYAYSNGDEDVPFLSTAGRARALNPGPGLAAEAARRDWPIARFRSRGRPGARELARTVGAVGGTLGGFAAGLALGALNSVAGEGTRREAVDLGLTLAGELGTALGGVRLDVRGAEHLMAARPAVFLFNHQSQLDVLILAKLLRSNFTAVAKKEAATVPGFGLAFRLADVAFVDRTDPTAARAALEPAVQRLREGISLVIAPEGTRSITPALGPFKKGAFHVAMQAGVPIVPIVIRNAGELMWRGASTLREGTVQVAVLPPIPTDGWTVEELDRHIEDVRGRYVEALAHWGGPAAGAAPSGKVAVTDGPAGPVGAPLDARPLRWGTAPEMNALETAMWRGEAADPRLRSNVTLLELLDPAPDWERLVASHEWASRMVPRMRQRVVEPALGIGAPTWATVDHLDLVHHLSRVRLRSPGTMAQALEVVQEFAAAPFDRSRPLWRALLVEGLEGGRAAYVVTTHHSATDGLGAVQLMGMLHSRSPEHDPHRPEPPEPHPERPVSPFGLLTDQVRRTARGVPGEVLRLGADVLGALSRPEAAAQHAVDAVRSLNRAVAPPSAGGSPLLAQRSGHWHFEVLDVPFDELRAGAKAAGGSLNDGYLAAVLGGFRRYHQHFGADLGTIPIGIPISLRTQDDPQGGNRFTGARLPGSLAEPDPAARIQAVREFVLTARAGTGVDVVGLLAPALTWLPGSVLGPASARLTSANDVQVSNLPGVGHPVYIAGSRITHMYPFGPLPGVAATITLLSHDGTCCIGLNLDPAAITEPSVLVAGLRAGLDEVVALAGSKGRGHRSRR